MITEQAIESVATAFCKLSKAEHKDLYLKALHSIARIARSEQILEMERDFEKCTNSKTLASFVARASNLPR